MRYTHLLLDIDGTLLDFEPAQRDAFFRTFEQHGHPADEAMLARYETLNSALWRRLERGEVSRAALFSLRFEQFFAEYGLNFDPDAFNRDYLANLSLGAFPLEGAVQLLEQLYHRFTLVSATNGAGATQRSRLARAGLLPHFSALAISEELGFEKPDRRFFEAALALAGSPPPAAVLMVGDSLIADVGGALDFGLDVCWFNPAGLVCPDTLHPTYTIRRLDQLWAVVDRQEAILCPDQP